MKTAPTSKKIRELISMVKEGKVTPRPEFQRRRVWTRNDKDYFLDTILRGYPFPEIYLADGDGDLETGQGTQLLVDGLQRVSTIMQYFEGGPDLKLTTVQPYRSLSEDDKKIFWLYDVAVRDLGAVSREEIIEVFKRINATPYSLRDIEVNNTVYTGALTKYAERLAEDDFFEHHKVFTAQDFKRMGDLRYALTVVITLIQGYFNRDDAFGELLDRYNDDFPLEPEINQRIHAVCEFIEECGLTLSSRVWKKADLFTLLIEIDQCLNVLKVNLQPSLVVEKLNKFYDAVEASGVDVSSMASIYYKAALQASNDRVNRLRRGTIIGGIIQEHTEDQLLRLLKERALA